MKLITPQCTRVLALAFTWLYLTSCAAPTPLASQHAATASKYQLKVAYAGFALAGRSADLSSHYPYTLAMEQKLNTRLYEDIGALNPQHYTLVADKLLDVRSGNTVGVAMVVDKESVVVRKIGASYQVVLTIAATALVFDFDMEEKAVIAAYPVPFPTYIDTFKQHPRPEQIATLVKAYYLGGLDDLPDGLLQAFGALLQAANIKQKYAREIGIGQVSVSAKAAAQLPLYLGQHAEAMQGYLADNFARALSQQQNVSMLPFRADNSLAVMSLRFTGNDDTVLLSLPAPDYVFDLHLQNLAKKLYDSKKAGQSYVYGARMNVTLRDPFEEETAPPVFTHSLIHGVSDVAPATQTLDSDWPVYEDALAGLFKRFAQNIDARDRKWVKRQKMDRSTLGQLKQVDAILEECR